MGLDWTGLDLTGLGWTGLACQIAFLCPSSSYFSSLLRLLLLLPPCYLSEYGDDGDDDLSVWLPVCLSSCLPASFCMTTGIRLFALLEGR